MFSSLRDYCNCCGSETMPVFWVFQLFCTRTPRVLSLASHFHLECKGLLRMPLRWHVCRRREEFKAMIRQSLTLYQWVDFCRRGLLNLQPFSTWDSMFSDRKIAFSPKELLQLRNCGKLDAPASLSLLAVKKWEENLSIVFPTTFPSCSSGTTLLEWSGERLSMVADPGTVRGACGWIKGR